ncbi:hypothetical protein KBB48_01215 [Candidatus Shapirobacteria bacterium]|nr:hypothetical protein [Candidatus Shapirobacteria bacterium]
MNDIQQIVMLVFGLISLLVAIKGGYEIGRKNNPFGEPFVLFWLGIFVWGDALVLGSFWVLVSLICFLLRDWILFWLIISVFWVVRSLGEILYWINQQFSPIIRNPPKNLLGFRFFKNDSIWFIYQIFWQCVLVVSIVTTIHVARFF